MTTADESAVLAAAARLVQAFASGAVADYFGCFDPHASFVFHTSPAASRTAPTMSVSGRHGNATTISVSSPADRATTASSSSTTSRCSPTTSTPSCQQRQMKPNCTNARPSCSDGPTRPGLASTNTCLLDPTSHPNRAAVVERLRYRATPHSLGPRASTQGAATCAGAPNPAGSIVISASRGSPHASGSAGCSPASRSRRRWPSAQAFPHRSWRVKQRERRVQQRRQRVAPGNDRPRVLTVPGGERRAADAA